MAFSKKNLESLIQVSIKNGASDVHMRSNEAPSLRIKGNLVPVQTKDFTFSDILDVFKILSKEDKSLEEINLIDEQDGAYEIEGLCRLRYNFFKYNSKAGIVLRIINTEIPSIADLNLPDTINQICKQQRGLVLLTGATGSGKSTSLAAMINQINATRATHIITIEDPIEYLHKQKKSRISQREIGIDTKDFTSGLRSALRQDPDIILIGEMRDPETVSIALKAAETGHLVLSTVHTTDAVNTIGRIMSLFQPEEQDYVRKRLSESLYATVSQRMIKSNAKSGVSVAQEIMITSPGIKECILGDEPLSRIKSIIQQGKGKGGNGSQSFDQHILSMYEKNVISKEAALEAVSSQSDFLQNLLTD